MRMVLLTEKPNLRPASCCNVDVVKGGAGIFDKGFLSIDLILYEASLQLCKKA